jgi:hypothetical protein
VTQGAASAQVAESFPHLWKLEAESEYVISVVLLGTVDGSECEARQFDRSLAMRAMREQESGSSVSFVGLEGLVSPELPTAS